MRGYRCVLVAAALVIAGAPGAYSREMDTGTITCGAFLASGRDNMAVIIMWLRGYHAGKHGGIPFDSNDNYGGKLGFYCRQHPGANLIEASERILTDLGRSL